MNLATKNLLDSWGISPLKLETGDMATKLKDISYNQLK